MALQDQPQNPPSLVDPKTGQPYPFGSPEYEAAIAPWVTGQIKSQSENAANARGMFYSGPAMADEIQAQQGALSTMAQQGAAQSIQEQELKQQEEFAAQQQKQAAEDNMAAAKAAAKGAMVGGAVQGGTGALGTLAGLYGYKKLFGPGGGGDTQITDALSPVTDMPLAANPGYDAAGFPLPGSLGPTSGGDLASATDYSMSTPADFSVATAGPGVGAEAPAALAPGIGDAGSLSLGGAGAGALASLPAAYWGAGAGERTFGNTPGNRTAAGVGGAVGAGLGALGGPLAPITMPIGAALGSFIGPGVAKGGQKVGNWIGQRLGF